MAKLILKKGVTDKTVYLFIQDSSVSTGAGLTGLAYNTTDLACYYVRPGGSATQISLATQTVTGAHSDGGFVEVDSTNMPGVYRLDLSDAVCASGVDSVVVMIEGAEDMAPCVLELQLDDYDLSDIDTLLDTIDGNVDDILEDTGTTIPGTITTIDGNVDSILEDTGTTLPNSITALNDLSTTDILDAVVEGAYSIQDVLKIMVAVLAGEVSGGGTTTITFRNLDDDTDRVIATVDTSGNRTAFTYDLS